jgi:hypothetical protein
VLRDLADDHGAVHAIRLAMSGHDVLAVMLERHGRAAGEAPDLSTLRSEVQRAWQLVHGSRYTDLGVLLPGLIPRAELTARQTAGEERKAAFSLLAVLYQATAAMMAKLGETDMAWVAADRSVVAAERADAPLLAVAGDFRLGHAFLGGGKLEQAKRVVVTAAAALEGRLADGPADLVALWGALHLVATIVAARQNDSGQAWAHLRKAESAAARLGEDRNDFHTEFGPTNVALHGLAVAVELGDPGEALRRSVEIDPSRLSPERRARYLIDVARAHGQRRNSGEAVASLMAAESLAPEEVRHFVLVQDMLRDLLRRERRRTSAELRALAERVGVI